MMSLDVPIDHSQGCHGSLAQAKMETMVPPCSMLQEVWLLTSKLHLHDITVALAFTRSHCHLWPEYRSLYVDEGTQA